MLPGTALCKRLWDHQPPCLFRRFKHATPGIIAKHAPLPPDDQWMSLFTARKQNLSERVSIRNSATAARILESFIPIAGKGAPKVVIEAFPGPGVMTRQLLSLPPSRLRKLIVLEDNETYLEYLKPLEELDDRLTILPVNGFDWASYQTLEEKGLLNDVEIQPWDTGVNPSLRFMSHIPHSIMGEQLVAQFFRCMPEKSWLFRYGRVPMHLLLGAWVWERISAPASSGQARCKLSVIAEAISEFRLGIPQRGTAPYDQHWHPVYNRTNERRPDSRKSGHPFVSINVVPKVNMLIAPGMLDKWDFVLRRLFVLKSTELKRAISTVAPGANALLQMLKNPDLPKEQRVDATLTIRQMTISDWALLMRAFDNWPFAPKDLGIADGFTEDKRREV